jgi:hypothetical protein
MAEQKQILVEPIIETGAQKGSRRQLNLNSCFSASPVYNELSDKERLETFLSLTKGIIKNGNGVNSFDTRYNGNDIDAVPNLNNVETGGSGLPSTPYSPNLTSPGPGSMNASAQPAYEGSFKDVENISNFGSGLGGLMSPHESSKNIANQSSLNQFIKGRSYNGSNG